MNVAAAAAYAERHALRALLVLSSGGVVEERYGAGWDAARPHPLYSGTKAFWGVLAVALASDGVLDLEEPVGATLAGWRDDPQKRKVTLQQLLQMTAGIGFGGLGSSVPTFAAAEAVALKHQPGGTFTYGGIPLQVFGAVLARKFGCSPHALLAERVLDPIGVRPADWRTLRDGTHPLPTGAFLSARAWGAYGQFVLAEGRADSGAQVVPAAALAACFRGSEANPRYGLGWWLAPSAGLPALMYASGSGGQALTVLPSERAVVVKFGASAAYKHDAFLKRLLGPESQEGGAAPREKRMRTTRTRGGD